MFVASVVHAEEVDGAKPLPGTSSESSIADLIFRAANDDHPESTAVSDVREFTFVLDSTSDSPDFSFQFDGRGTGVYDEDKACANRRTYECRALGAIALLFMDCYLPTQIAIGGDVYSFNYVPPWQHVRNARWDYLPTARPIHTWLEVSNKEREPGGLVRVDLGEFLRGVVAPEDAGFIWMPDCRSLRLDRSNGVTYTLRIRTPNDAERYGTSLSQLRNVSNDGVSSFAWSHFMVGHPSVLRFQRPTKEALDKAIGEWETTEYDDRPLPPSGSRTGEPVRALWNTLVAFPRCDVADAPNTKADTNKSEKTIVSLCKYIAVLRMTRHVGSAAMQCDAMAHGLIKELRAAERCIRKGLETETNGMGIDDPLLLWRACEMQLTSRVAATVHGAGLTLMNDCPTSAEAKYLFCDALADMGTPCVDFIGGNTVGSALSDDPVVRGILHSHWQWECPPAEAEACEALVRAESHGTEVERVAIEALVRMNRLDGVPADRLAGWFESEAVNADELTLTETLRILSQVPKGQQYLIRRSEDQSLDVSVRTAIVKMLVYRAEATLRTKRFDFLSEGDCRRILELQRTAALREPDVRCGHP
jgi:hypothetical protein